MDLESKKLIVSPHFTQRLGERCVSENIFVNDLVADMTKATSPQLDIIVDKYHDHVSDVGRPKKKKAIRNSLTTNMYNTFVSKKYDLVCLTHIKKNTVRLITCWPFLDINKFPESAIAYKSVKSNPVSYSRDNQSALELVGLALIFSLALIGALL